MSWKHYAAGEWYANINGRKCWVSRDPDGGWRADVYNRGDWIVAYVRRGHAGPLSWAEAKLACEEIAAMTPPTAPSVPCLVHWGTAASLI